MRHCGDGNGDGNHDGDGDGESSVTVGVNYGENGEITFTDLSPLFAPTVKVPLSQFSPHFHLLLSGEKTYTVGVNYGKTGGTTVKLR